MHLYVQPCLTATTAVVSRILARLALTEQLLSEQLHPTGGRFELDRLRSARVITRPNRVIDVKQLLVAARDRFHQLVGRVVAILREYFVHTSDFVLGHLY